MNAKASNQNMTSKLCKEYEQTKTHSEHNPTEAQSKASYMFLLEKVTTTTQPSTICRQWIIFDFGGIL